MSLRSIWCTSTWMRFVEIIRGQPICYIIQPKSINIHLTMQRNKYWFRLLVVVVFFSFGCRIYINAATIAAAAMFSAYMFVHVYLFIHASSQINTNIVVYIYWEISHSTVNFRKIMRIIEVFLHQQPTTPRWQSTTSANSDG